MKKTIALPGILLVALLLKGILLYVGVVSFDSDEAVVGLMARHILQGARPIFFYGQAYMGSLDAYLVAGAFALLGESVLAVRVVQLAMLVVPHAYSSATGAIVPRQAFSYSNSVIGRSPAQSAYAASSAQLR